MLADCTPITFTAVAHRAQVSTWLVHADGIREAIEQARNRQRSQPAVPHAGATPSPTSLQTDLALAREEIKRLRVHADELRGNLRRALGTQLDNRTKSDLVARIDELSDHYSRLQAEAHDLRGGNDRLQARIAELEDDLAAARTSLRRMIRAENRPT